MKRIYEKTVKRALLSTLIILFSMVSFAATYYVSNTGNDSNSGLSATLPWQTLGKVNAATFAPGDQVLFSRGGTFYGSLTIKSSGASGSPITYGAFGTGANPVITGFSAVNGWTSLGGNIWESTSAVSSLPTCNMVVINGVNTPMGRFPNSGYFHYQTYTANSITSNQLTGTPNWTGAELAFNSSDWTIMKDRISSQSGGTVNFATYTTIYGGDLKFIIQNDPRTLDIQNEWYYNPTTKKLRIYSAAQPSDVKVSTVERLVSAYGKNFVTFDNLSLTGSNSISILLQASNNFTLQNSSVTFSGLDGIHGDWSGTSDNMKVEKCIFDQSNNWAIGVTSLFPNAIIRSNTITNSGMIYGGSSYPGNTEGIGMMYAIATEGDGTLIENNVINNVGYVGIRFHGSNTTVQNNLITNFVQRITDGGAIYSYNGGTPNVTWTNTKLRNNIIINDPTKVDAVGDINCGIYLDHSSNGVEVSGNTICGVDLAMFFGTNRNITVLGNTTFNNDRGIRIYQFSPNGIGAINVQNNIFVAKTATQLALHLDPIEGIKQYWNGSNNYYARPINDTKIIEFFQRTPSWVYGQMTVAEWQAYTGKDLNSLKSAVTVTSESDFQLEYNATQSPKTVSLSRSMIDVKGNKYSGSVTLQPFTSVVLMRDPNGTATVLPISYNVTGGGSYTSGGTGVAIGLSGSQTGVNYQLMLAGVNNGSVVAGTGSAISFGNKTAAGVYTVTATVVSSGSIATMTGSATVTINAAAINVTGVSASPTSASLLVNATQQLAATLSPTNATNKTVSWGSSNTSVATVNSNGLVTGVAAGSATITATTQDGSKTCTSAITVSNPIISVTAISVNLTSASISTGATQQLTATVSPTNATNKAVSWSSSNASVATVNANGLVTGVAAGSATITATTQEGGKTASTTITVINSNVLVTGVSVSPTSASIYIYATQQLTATVAPTNATNKTVSWSSNNTSIATVNSTGLVTGVAAGNATLTATTQDGGKTASISVTVNSSTILVTSVSVSPTLSSIFVNGNQQLTATISPTNATNKTVNWSSDNASVATVNGDGLVTGVAVGSATITATTQNGSKIASSTITVKSSGTAFLGYNVKGSSVYASNAGAMNASQFTASSSFTATTMYISMPAGNSKIKGAIYSDKDGNPGTKLGETSTITATVQGFQKLTGLNVPIVSGTKYWLVVWGSAAYKIDCEMTGGNLKWKAVNTRNWWESYQRYGYLPTTFPKPDGSSIVKYSIYVDGGLKGATLNESAMETKDIEILTEEVKIDVFPNPSIGRVTVRYSTLPEAGSKIEILDMSGRKVDSRLITGDTEEFHLENLPNGVYLVKSILGRNETIQKLILKK